MRFRPCIDLHDGRVKQIVGSTLTDAEGAGRENYVSDRPAAFYADLYKKHHLAGGHIILLNKQGSEGYEKSLSEAKEALQTYEGGLQIGGGITLQNAAERLSMGASHIIVTSCIFRDGRIDRETLKSLVHEVGREHIVIDLSSSFRDGAFSVLTDRWQKTSSELLTEELMLEMEEYSDEFLIHAADAEGKMAGPDVRLLSLLSEFHTTHPLTYAGGIHELEDVLKVDRYGHSNLDFTVGSALDIFGGSLSFQELVAFSEALSY